METWFARAVSIDPDDESAYVSKFYYLSPRWQGDPEGRDALSFGRACSATKNWRNGVELLGSEAIFYQAMTLGPADRRRYMTQPESWATIRGDYDDYLRRYPYNFVPMSKYAFLAYLCEQYEAADMIFRRLGDNLTTWDGMVTVPLRALKGFRAFCADKVADKNKPAGRADGHRPHLLRGHTEPEPTDRDGGRPVVGPPAVVSSAGLRSDPGK